MHQNVPSAPTARNANMELLRIVSMLMILTLHFFAQGQVLTSVTPSHGFNYHFVWITESVCLISVNCYMLLSGFFLYRVVFRWRRVLSLYLQVVFYSLILAPFCFLLRLEPLSIDSLLLFPPVSGRNNWYVTVYFALVFLSPVLNADVRNTSRQVFRALLLMLFFLFYVIPTCFFYVDQFNLGGGYTILWYMFVYLLGAYIGKYNIHNTPLPPALLFCSILLLPLSKGLMEVASRRFGRLVPFTRFLYTYNAVPVLLAAIAVFLFFVRLRIQSPVLSRIINAVGKTTFGVFYIHSYYLLRPHLWVALGSLKYLDSPLFVPYTLCAVLFIFTLCSLVDLARASCFRRVGLDRLILSLDEKLSRILPIR